MGQNEIDGIFNWLKSLKSIHKISYDTMAKAIGYSAVGVSKAIKNETLSKDQVREIANYVGYGDHFDELFLTNTNEKTPPKEVRLETMIAKKVVEELSPYLKDFQKGHNSTGQQIHDLTELVKSLVALLIKVKYQVDQNQEDLKKIKEYSKEMHEIVTPTK